MSSDSILRSLPPSAAMMLASPSPSKRPRRRSHRLAASPLALCLALSQPATSFLQQQQQGSQPLTRVNFQDVDIVERYSPSSGGTTSGGVPTTFMPVDHSVVGGFAGLPSTTPPQFHDSSSSSSTISKPQLPAEYRSRMPPWLQTPLGHLAESNLSTLRTAMTSTYLSEAEAQTVLSAIQDAASGDENKVAGAAEFCHILVDTMEMGVTSLVAAAFHYCTCVTARERAAMSLSSFSAASLGTFWETIHHQEQEAKENASPTMYGSYAAQIARDAARLKKTEAVASGSSVTSSKDDSYVNMQNLLLSETRDWRALAIRSAACLYRLRGLLAVRGDATHPLSPQEVRESRDALHIYAPLASRLGMHRLKNELEGAAFRLKYRRQYDRVMALGMETRILYDGHERASLTVGEGMAHVLHHVAENLKYVLDSDVTFSDHAADVVVSARVKEPYSLWKKILKTRVHKMLDVPDALALRVVLNARKDSPDEPDDVTAARERAMCYYVQELCTAHWQPDVHNDGGRFKDYIETPKPNGYQSLHYTATTNWGGVDWPLEIQVRTGEMHRVAEYGLAAHFDYKEYAKRETSTAKPRSLNDETYLQAVQDWHWQQVQRAAQPEEEQGEPSYTKIGAGYNPAYDEDRAQRVRARAERIAPYIESFNAAQSDLTRNHVFVFLASPVQSDSTKTTGTIVSLPSGSCILDALREGARRFESMDLTCFQGKTHGGVQRNGLAASSVTEKLCNGDVITLPTCSRADGTNSYYAGAGEVHLTP